MNTTATTPLNARYGWASITLHWVMLVLIVAVYACMELKGFFPKGSALRAGLETWHFMLGLSVLVLVAVRVTVRLTSTAPPIQPEPPLWQMALGHAMHWALYVFMIGMPLLGWLTLSAQGKEIPFFFTQLPALMSESKSVAGWVKDIHEVGGTVGYFLIAMHAAVALFHHYFLRDNTLRRMWPF